MRHAVLGLLAAAGCNQIWGLDPVDLAPPGDGPGDGGNTLRVHLRSQITRTDAAGFVDLTLDYGPITPPPAVQVGPVGGQVTGARYDSVEGAVPYPAELVGQPWRLVYTLTDGIPREVQWSPPDGDLVAQIVEPLFGRAERLPVPAGGGYVITPVGSPAQHTLTRVFTTGLWTEGVFTGTLSGATVNYDFGAKARSFSGPLGAPENAKVDHAVLADFRNSLGCRVTSGVAAFVVPDMVAGSLTPPAMQPTYLSADKQVRLTLAGTSIDARLQGLLGSRASATDLLRMEYGYTPSLGVFGFSKVPPSPVLDFYLPGPQLIAFANCTFPQGTGIYQSEAFADPIDLYDAFPRIVHVEVVNQRVKGLITLTSGFSAVVTSIDYNFTSDFSVAAPTGIKLLQNGMPIADLENLADESTPLPMGTAPVELVFGIEPGAMLLADSFEILLYSIANNKLDLQRIYTVTDRKLTIEPGFLQPATEYVFEVRAYRGRPDIPRGNFATNAYPQFAVSLFTRTFKTP
jgi:hypothetical protein